MHRFYSDPDCSSDETALLTPEDAHHALDVLRLHEGSNVELIDRGNRFSAVIESAENKNVLLRKISPLPSTETHVSFSLFQGIPKGDKMDLIVQKAVELGVVRIIPVKMSRCVIHLDDKDAIRKRDRWQKIAREAGKQCGRCIVPEVFHPVPLHNLDTFRDLIQKLVVPWESADRYGPLAFVRDHPDIQSLGIIIGPEGGIGSDEMEYLSTLSATPLTLGRRILRTETAGLAAISAFSALYGEME